MFLKGVALMKMKRQARGLLPDITLLISGKYGMNPLVPCKQLSE
jgi:hypothetical protein